MATLTTLPVEMIEQIFEAMLATRRRDNCAEGFLDAINLARTCRIMRDIGLRIILVAEPRLKRSKKDRRRFPALQRRLPNRKEMTSHQLCTEFLNLEMRCISRLMSFVAFQRQLVRSHKSIIRRYRHLPECITSEAIEEEEDRLAPISGRNVWRVFDVCEVERFYRHGYADANS